MLPIELGIPVWQLVCGWAFPRDEVMTIVGHRDPDVAAEFHRKGDDAMHFFKLVLAAGYKLQQQMSEDEFCALEIVPMLCRRTLEDEEDSPRFVRPGGGPPLGASLDTNSAYVQQQCLSVRQLVASLAFGTLPGDRPLFYSEEGMKDANHNVVEYVAHCSEWKGDEFEVWKRRLFDEVFGQDNPHSDNIVWATFQTPTQMREFINSQTEIMYDEHSEEGDPIARPEEPSS